MNKYQETKKECQDSIDKLGNVCDYCGRKIVPLETVDNANNPTHWSGCRHGEFSGHFTVGVRKEIFELAEKLVCNGERLYSSNEIEDSSRSLGERKYYFQGEVNRMCRFLSEAEYLKTHDPRKTKAELLGKETSQ